MSKNDSPVIGTFLFYGRSIRMHEDYTWSVKPLPGEVADQVEEVMQREAEILTAEAQEVYSPSSGARQNFVFEHVFQQHHDRHQSFTERKSDPEPPSFTEGRVY